MSKSDKEVDQLIHEALSQEEAAYFDKMGEQNIPQQLFGLFKGKNRWMNVVMVIMNVVVLAVAFYTFVNMLDTENQDEKLEWMFYTLISFMTMMLFKLWGWNQMDKNVLMREIKRLEYQVSLLKKEK
ncbi:DUF6768 family protein [Roseivirga misakiensis]|uniref:Uncharacterized protein n=1 Tax=Roseivirga misakiensis TaxID=1563681 RepID=A0A1E5SXZ7_9BACT|nr:DUF6768 family protein [Roseivirga misakiensis]OEK04003.1 hypothetical protein BFP71_10930 [Roseivirga misakiensis]